MLQPPSLKQALLYPVTTSVAVLAMIVTGMHWTGQDIEWLTMKGRIWSNWELCRALTATLPHGGVFHLAFNLYWLWTFGTLVERVYGHLKYALILILLAFGSMLAEFTFLEGGIGLSGVGYGLWGMLWVLEKRDARFADAVDFQTSRLFVIWFVLCIVLTLTNVMPVANLAHGVGAITGVLLGMAAIHSGAARWKSCAGLVLVLAFGILGSTVLWPTLNLTPYAEEQIEQAGVNAIVAHDPVRGEKFLEVATGIRRAPARTWYNLGVAREQLGQMDGALAAFDHAAAMLDGDNDMQNAADRLRSLLKIRSSMTQAAGSATNLGTALPTVRTNQ